MIELITTSIFIINSVYGGPTIVSNIKLVSTTSSNSISIVSTNTLEDRMIAYQKQVEVRAKEYFKDDPILVEVARCESSFRQIGPDGKILRGKVNKGDVGLMQINEYYHGDKAFSLGFDLETLDGNMGYAKYLYNKEGLQPWISSKPCWSQALKTDSSKQIALK